MCDSNGLMGWSDERLLRELDVQTTLLRLREWHVQDALDAVRDGVRRYWQGAPDSRAALWEAVEAEVHTAHLYHELLEELSRRCDEAGEFYGETWEESDHSDEGYDEHYPSDEELGVPADYDIEGHLYEIHRDEEIDVRRHDRW